MFYLIIVLYAPNYVLSELITMTALGAAALAGAWYKWDTPIKDYTICRYMECCNEAYVPYDLMNLKQSFAQKMFGQPLVNELINILSAHKAAVYDKSVPNKKALVISLHGLSGVGKNYAASLIAEALYKKGMKSKYVKLFFGKKDFDCTDVEKSQKELITKVSEMVKKCPKSLIIFDEIHHMCPTVLDAIKPMFDHYHAVDGIDFRDTIFIFISNTGGKQIADHLLDMYVEGMTRNDVEFHNFEPIIRRTAYYEGGLEKSGTIAQHLIDHYIPFLPLEQHHVELCALAEFRAHGILQPTKEMMTDALSVITYGPTENQAIFANNGCRRLARQVQYVIHKYKIKEEL
ncbi:torsin family member [Aphomia sociella]